jgi:chloride channel 7
VQVPGGVFIPSLITGAAMGRFIGVTMQFLDPTDRVVGVFADRGTYALVGACANLAG